ncbi:hypothetical protein L6R49_26945 [Myxococcota bacterium]|nr:hypothetical protein [Myxococcota bacterium]
MHWPRALIIVIMLGLGGLAAAPTAVAGKEERAVKQETRQLRRETARLGELAEAYWRAARWGDRALMGLSIQDAARRAVFLTGTSATSFRAAEVVQVVVSGPVHGGDGAGPTRVAEVIIRVEAWGADQLVVEQQVLAQRWYRDARGWWVEPGDELGHPYRTPEP